ncbi:hypothetical protein [Paludibaculum fermentans]|uniref:hypothetical protein n=1 Tax=Paludibaculum fermentans TaxID=1473598 RepID=UPI003EBB92E7
MDETGNPGLTTLAARSLLKPVDVSYALGGMAGAGSIALIATGSIVITSNGSISSPGMSGSPWANNPNFLASASAGGIVILGSRTSISNAGSLIATGGNGANGIPDYNAGGGGGGGIIHLLGPSIVSGTTDVSGGSGGMKGTASGFPVFGGACGGSGGRSGETGSPGGVGYVFRTIVAEPASLFVP